MKITVEIITEEKLWKRHKEIRTLLVKKVIKVISNHFPNLQKIKHIELAILLTNNSKMYELNSEFRSKDKTTNVLSFPDMTDDIKKILEFGKTSDYIRLGDLAFGYDVITKESEEQNKCFEHHFIHLLIHGLLHLIGLDHETNDKDADVMEAAEIAILNEFSIKSPY